MESKITKLTAIFLLFMITFIQVIAAPSPTNEKIADVEKLKIQSFLASKEHLAKIKDVFNIAKKSTSDAKEKVKTYSTKKLPADLKKLLDEIADKPHEVWDEMKPLLEDMSGKLKEMDKKYQEESMVYRMLGKPLWTFISGVGYLSAGTVGYAMQTVGGLLQLFTDGVNESVAGYKKDAEPNETAAKVYQTIDSRLQTFKNWGNDLGDLAKEKLLKNHKRGQLKKSNSDSDDGSMHEESVEPATPPKPAKLAGSFKTYKD